MIDLSAFVTIEPMTGPYSIQHYNKYASVAVNGAKTAGVGLELTVERPGSMTPAPRRAEPDVVPDTLPRLAPGEGAATGGAGLARAARPR